MNIKTKKISLHISSIIVLILVISFSAILSFNFYKSSQNSFAYLEKLTNEFSHRTTSKVQNYLNNTNTSLKVISQINEEDIFKNEQLNISLMYEYLKESKYLSSMYIANKNGDFLQVRNYPKLATRKIIHKNNTFEDIWKYRDQNFITKDIKIIYDTFDARKRIWYKNVRKDKIFISTPYMFESTNELGITISFAKFDETGKKIFVVAADISLKSLNKFLKEQAIKLEGDIALISSTYSIISDTKSKDMSNISKSIYDKNINTITINASKIYFNNKKEKNITDIQNNKYIFSGNDFKIDTNSFWHLIIVIPENKILGNVKQALLETMFISFIILILFILISIKIANTISKPISMLSKDLQELKELNLDINIDNSSSIKEINDAQNSLLLLQNGLKYFSKYMPSDLVKILIKNNKELKIGGVDKNLAIMFTDIENFTTICESSKPEDLTAQLAVYFELINKIISKHNGTIDKYIGDAVMAFWGAPIDIENPVNKSVLAAIEIQKELEILNNKWQKENKPQLKTRIGVHYGKAIVGNIGSIQRMNYTIIGDSVNIAARLEAVNKNYNTYLMISQEVQSIIKNDFKTEFIDSIKLKGKNTITNIYTISS